MSELNEIYHWLDRIIEKQKANTEIINKMCSPSTPAELQKIAEYKGLKIIYNNSSK